MRSRGCCRPTRRPSGVVGVGSWPGSCPRSPIPIGRSTSSGNISAARAPGAAFPTCRRRSGALEQMGVSALRRLELRRPASRRGRRPARAGALGRSPGDLVGSRLPQAASVVLPRGLRPPRAAAGAGPVRRRRCGERRPGAIRAGLSGAPARPGCPAARRPAAPGESDGPGPPPCSTGVEVRTAPSDDGWGCRLSRVERGRTRLARVAEMD